jgi:hypothetical protein
VPGRSFEVVGSRLIKIRNYGPGTRNNMTPYHFRIAKHLTAAIVSIATAGLLLLGFDGLLVAMRKLADVVRPAPPPPCGSTIARGGGDTRRRADIHPSGQQRNAAGQRRGTRQRAIAESPERASGQLF